MTMLAIYIDGGYLDSISRDEYSTCVDN